MTGFVALLLRSSFYNGTQKEITMSYNNLFSIPVSQKKRLSMRRKFIVFSSVLFLLIFVLGSVVFVFLMRQILHNNAENELMQVVEFEKLKLEAYVNSEIAIVRKMATSPLIQHYFLDQNNKETARIALEDFEGYRRTFAPNSIFWVNDVDRKYYWDGKYAYTVDPAEPASYWYNMTIHETQTYNFNINTGSSTQFVSRFHIGPTFNFTENAWLEAVTGVSNAYGNSETIEVFALSGLFSFGSILVGFKF